MIESLLAELDTFGWTISWAFQFAPDHWRMSITKISYWNGYDQPDYYVTHCADAASFAEALEDCMSKLADAEFVEGAKVDHSNEPTPKPQNLLLALGLLKPIKIERRI